MNCLLERIAQFEARMVKKRSVGFEDYAEASCLLIEAREQIKSLTNGLESVNDQLTGALEESRRENADLKETVADLHDDLRASCQDQLEATMGEDA